MDISRLNNLELAGVVSILTKIGKTPTPDMITKLKSGIIKAERVFERGQIILALLPYSSVMDRKNWITLYKNDLLLKITLADCFQLNWDCQVIAKLNNRSLVNHYSNLVIELFNTLKTLLNANKKGIETDAFWLNHKSKNTLLINQYIYDYIIFEFAFCRIYYTTQIISTCFGNISSKLTI